MFDNVVGVLGAAEIAQGAYKPDGFRQIMVSSRTPVVPSCASL